MRRAIAEGRFAEALYHLDAKLIATRAPEEIRGGGLLKCFKRLILYVFVLRIIANFTNLKSTLKHFPIFYSYEPRFLMVW